MLQRIRYNDFLPRFFDVYLDLYHFSKCLGKGLESIDKDMLSCFSWGVNNQVECVCVARLHSQISLLNVLVCNIFLDKSCLGRPSGRAIVQHLHLNLNHLPWLDRFELRVASDNCRLKGLLGFFDIAMHFFSTWVNTFCWYWIIKLIAHENIFFELLNHCLRLDL